jgi:glycerol kinase
MAQQTKRTHVLAIDQGTTSSRAVVFDRRLRAVAMAQRPISQHFPQPGWVEHDPEEIWRSVVATARRAIRDAGIGPEKLAAIGVTNQRETVVVWDRRTGEPIHRAIVWQDRRTAEACAVLRGAGHERAVQAASGLVLDPYFSASKVAWLLDHVKGARKRAEAGDLCFGTIDAFLVWRLTGGQLHATDATNASRTMLYDIHRGAWSDPLMSLFGVPRALLPEVRDCAADYGVTAKRIFGAEIPISGVAGDQQAALVGQGCFAPGMVKATYGTGCFALMNTGEAAVASSHRLLTTIAYQLHGRRTYALEGAIFVAGAAVQWLRDGLRVIAKAAEAGELARRSDPAQPVYLVPAFVGLGAPHWDSDARGAIFGLTRGTTNAELARAALEAACYQTRDLLDAIAADWSGTARAQNVLRVDGGMAASDWTMQFLADILDAPVDRPTNRETTAAGAAYLAGYAAGLYAAPVAQAERRPGDRRFLPRMDAVVRATKLAGWRDAVRRTLTV